MGFVETNPAYRKREEIAKIETREQQRMSSLSPLLTIMVKAVQKAGGKVIRDFGELSHLQIKKKGLGDFVSETDLRVEKTLIESLQKDRPDYGFISEEYGEIPAKNGSPFTFIIDPIDGTTNFIHAIPYCCISVAVKEGDEIIAAVVLNPITRELFFAEKGKGAFAMEPSRNRRLRVSGRTQISDCLVRLCGLNDQKESELIKAFGGKVAGMRSFGSAVLEMTAVAGGQLDAFIGKNSKLWDIAANILFIREAGGMVATVSGKKDLASLTKDEFIIACSLSLFPKFQKALSKGE